MGFLFRFAYMRKFIIFAIILFFYSTLYSQSFYKSSKTGIPDGGTLYDTLNVSGLATSMGANFGIEDVRINITHPNIGELTVWIISPNGTPIELTEQNGNGTANYPNTNFNYNSGTEAIYIANTPFTGNFQPQEWMGTLNTSLQNPNGKWILEVNDCCTGNVGTLNNWSVVFGNKPAPILSDTTRLPIIELFDNGQTIGDADIQSFMKVIDNPGGVLNHYNDTPSYTGYINISLRGNTSQTFPQKPYGLTTTDSLGNSLDTTILGFPSEHKWIFYPPYDDKSLMRNTFIFNISNQIGRYASRTKYFELYINGMYEGIYVLMEKVDQNKNRVDIKKLKSTSTSGTAVTGGYIFKLDHVNNGDQGWYGATMVCDTPSNTTESLNYLYYYPTTDSIVPQQASYIQNFVGEFENAFLNYSYYDTTNGYKHYVDLSTFVDHSLMVELSRNVDGYRLSSYYHKDNDSKDPHLQAGPIWDYNETFGMANYLQGSDPTVWQWGLVCPGNPVWWELLFEQDSVYQKDYKCRYTNLRQNVLSWGNITKLIDSLYGVVQYEQVKTYQRWPILGYYTWPNDYYPPTYNQEIDTLRNWIQHRLNWMDSQLFDSSCLGINPLPVTLISFDGKFVGSNNVLLNWKVANEKNIYKYVVEKSTNSQDFIDIGEVNADGKATYAYNDNLGDALESKLYYRLKIIDANGNYKYSNVFSIYVNSTVHFSLQPNPAKTTVTVEGNDIKQIRVIDCLGKTVFSKLLTNVASTSNIDVQQLPCGLYIIQIIDKDGNVGTQKLIVD
jgi:subtilisin-like proprotein convertase family protein